MALRAAAVTCPGGLPVPNINIYHVREIQSRCHSFNCIIRSFSGGKVHLFTRHVRLPGKARARTRKPLQSPRRNFVGLLPLKRARQCAQPSSSHDDNSSELHESGRGRERVIIEQGLLIYSNLHEEKNLCFGHPGSPCIAAVMGKHTGKCSHAKTNLAKSQ